MFQYRGQEGHFCSRIWSKWQQNIFKTFCSWNQNQLVSNKWFFYFFFFLVIRWTMENYRLNKILFCEKNKFTLNFTQPCRSIYTFWYLIFYSSSECTKTILKYYPWWSLFVGIGYISFWKCYLFDHFYYFFTANPQMFIYEKIRKAYI